MNRFIPILASLAVFFLLLTATDSQAMLTYAKARHKAIAACKDKQPGDKVLFINRHSKRVEGICQYEEGELIAVSLKKNRNP